jgi:sulfur-oxidizing protein SoxY
MKRRNFIKSVFGASAVAFTLSPTMVLAEDKKAGNRLSYDEAEKVITGGKGATHSETIKLTVPEIAENGAVVPVKVLVDHPMEEASYVKAIHILATKNGNSRCADVMLSPHNAKAYFATRIKLGGTQNVVALVELSNGTFIKNAKSVKVTIGGCG